MTRTDDRTKGRAETIRRAAIRRAKTTGTHA